MEDDEPPPPPSHHHHRHFPINHHLSIFPPINHEGLPIPRAPLSVDLTPSPSPPPPSKCNKNLTQLIKWSDFALHFWNSKLVSFFAHFPFHGLFLWFRRIAATATFLGFVWFWVSRRRRRRLVVNGGGGGGGEETIEHLKALVQAKDEKIIQLLEQIAQMNKVLLAQCRIPGSKGS